MASKSYRALSDSYVWGFGILSLLGLADAFVLTAEHYIKLNLPCTFSGGCEQVLTSKFATIAGVPISWLGVVFYGVVLFLVLTAFANNQRLPSRFLVGWGAVGFASSAVLTSLQAFVIRAWCQYCLLSALTSTLIFILAIIHWRRSPNETIQEEQHEEA